MTKERAREVLNAVLHPDTGEPVSPFVLRLSCIVPANMSLDCLMILARTPIQTAGAQAINQCYNAAHYYANRNHSNVEPTARVAASFTAATASSVSAALWLQRAAASMHGTRAIVLRRCAPFLAVAAADVLNLGVMRSDEWMRGVVIRSESTDAELGKSRVAGAMGVSSCIAARVMAAAPVLLSSAFALEAMERSALFGTAGRLALLRVPIALAVLASAIVVAVPLTFGLFRQDAHVPGTWLEREFHSEGTVWYHKGL
jgi:hypothetical protein